MLSKQPFSRCQEHSKGLSVPEWERSVKHSLSFLDVLCGLIFTDVKEEDN